MDNIHKPHESPNFSLVLGGPTYQLLLRFRLADSAFEHVRKRMIVISMFAWLPLLLLALLNGTVWSGVELPFLYDIEVHARFLVALPLLIYAELLIHQRMRLIVGQFIDRDIITESVLPKFKGAIAAAFRLRNSVVIELALFILIFVGGYFSWGTVSVVGDIGVDAGTWYATLVDGDIHISPAGYWYIVISRPVFQFILVRWYFRLFIWARFLWQVSRLDLKLVPTHPDRAAGLGFLGASASAMAPFVLAHGALLAGLIANQIFFAEAKLTDFKLEIVSFVGVLMLFVLGPLLVFSMRLMQAKRTGLREYGILASNYVNAFDKKWIRGGSSDDEPLVGSGDIQSLADLGNSFQVIREIKPFPFGRDTIVQLVMLTILPGMPLVLTMIPLEELVTKLIGVVF